MKLFTGGLNGLEMLWSGSYSMGNFYDYLVCREVDGDTHSGHLRNITGLLLNLLKLMHLINTITRTLLRLVRDILVTAHLKN